MSSDGAKGDVGGFFIRFFQIFWENLDLAGAGTGEGGDQEMRNFMGDGAWKKNKAPDNYGRVLISTQAMDEVAEISC